MGLLPFAVWILTAPLGRAGFRQEYLNRAVGVPLWSKFLQEGHRYSDLLGLNMLHGHGLEHIPVGYPYHCSSWRAAFCCGSWAGDGFIWSCYCSLPLCFGSCTP